MVLRSWQKIIKNQNCLNTHIWVSYEIMSLNPSSSIYVHNGWIEIVEFMKSCKKYNLTHALISIFFQNPFKNYGWHCPSHALGNKLHRLPLIHYLHVCPYRCGNASTRDKPWSPRTHFY